MRDIRTIITEVVMCATLLGLHTPLYGQGINSYRLFEIVVNQEAGRVTFDFSWEKGWWWFKRKVPVKVFTLGVYSQDGSRLLWEILSPDGSAAASQIRYGEVPVGFQQTTPKGSPPPVLQPGVTYNVHARGEGGLGGSPFTFERP